MGVLALRVSSAILAFVSTLLITRLYGAQWAGTFFLSVAVVTVSASLSQLGIDLPLMRMIAVARDVQDWSSVQALVRRALFIGATAAASLTILIMVFSPWAGRVLSESSLAPMLRIMATATIPYTLILLMARALSAVDRPALAELVHRTAFQVGFISLLLSLSFALGELVLGVAFAVAYWIVTAVGWGAWRRVTRSRGANASVTSRTLLRPGAPLLLAASLFLTINWADTLMLGYFGSAEMVGVYGAAIRVSATMTMILAAATAVYAPRLAALHARGDNKALQHLVRRVAAGSTIVALPLLAILVAVPQPIMSIFGRGFEAGGGTLAILAAGQFINVAIGVLGALLAMVGKEARVLIVVSVSALLNVSFNILLIPRLGIAGAALATAICFVATNLGYSFFVRRDLGIVLVGRGSFADDSVRIQLGGTQEELGP